MLLLVAVKEIAAAEKLITASNPPGKGSGALTLSKSRFASGGASLRPYCGFWGPLPFDSVLPVRSPALILPSWLSLPRPVSVRLLPLSSL